MNIRNFEVIVENLERNPHCLHGPTLIFRKNSGKGDDYYACSASRDHKGCNFRHSVNEKKKVLLKSSKFWKERQTEIVSSINKLKPYKKFIKIVDALKNSTEKNDSGDLEKTSKSQTGYCYTCNLLFEKHDFAKHENCNVLLNLTHYQIIHPTMIIIPVTNTKTHAQYFFSEPTVKDILLLLSRMNVSKVLCIGVPRIHEYLLNNCKKKIQSLLLDFDKNYFNFYSKNQFIWYNMFNNYIFDATQKEILHKFLQSGKIVVLMDPPFGGRVEPLARTLNMLNEVFLDVNKETSMKGKLKLKTFWFFPYFMEQHIRNSLPDFKMFDYKVNYDNHSSFTEVGNRKRKFGSPVRIFTNVLLSQLDLNGVAGYKFCGSCGYWVSSENKHCQECNACTSKIYSPFRMKNFGLKGKNGRTYIHCSKCSKCVKPSYKHCDTCSRCCLPDHVCGEFQPDQNCYHCHQPGHKKRECLLLNESKKCSLDYEVPKKRKRKITEEV